VSASGLLPCWPSHSTPPHSTATRPPFPCLSSISCLSFLLPLSLSPSNTAFYRGLPLASRVLDTGIPYCSLFSPSLPSLPLPDPFCPSTARTSPNISSNCNSKARTDPHTMDSTTARIRQGLPAFHCLLIGIAFSLAAFRFFLTGASLLSHFIAAVESLRRARALLLYHHIRVPH